MHPALHHSLVQARHHGRMRAAAQQRLAAHAKAAQVRAARRDDLVLEGMSALAGTRGDEHWLMLGPGMLGCSMERQVECAKRRLAGDDLTWDIWRERRTGALRPVIERLHMARDDDAGRSCDLDDPGELAAWRAWWPPAALWLLAIGGRLAAYCLAEPGWPLVRVIDSRMVTGFARYSPGRLLEAAVLEHYAGAGYMAVLWGAGHPEALIAASSC